MCKICEIKNGESTEVISDSCVSLWLLRWYDGEYELEVDGEESETVSINYCPFCGRNLTTKQYDNINK